MAAGKEKHSSQRAKTYDFLRDLNPTLTQILCKIESEPKCDVVNELLEEIGEELLLESREWIFKSAVSRYVKIYEAQCQDPMVTGVPVLILKKRSGDSKDIKNCNDIVDLAIYASEMGDTFPRDVLSSPSKFIELRKKDIVVGATDRENTVEGDKTTPKIDKNQISVLANRIRDQEMTIEKLTKELCSTKCVLMDKMNTLEHVIRSLLGGKNKANNFWDDNKGMHNHPRAETNPKPPHKAPTSGHNSTPECPPQDYEQFGASRSVVIHPPEKQPDRQKTTADQNVDLTTSEEVGHQEREQEEELASTSSYRDIAAREGPWMNGSNRKQRRDLRKNLKGKEPKKTYHLEGKIPDKTSLLYLRNVGMTNEDYENDVIDSVKAFALEHCVKVSHASIVYNRYSDSVVGVKINVPETQKQTVLQDEFWPCNITCREWRREKPQYHRQQEEQADGWSGTRLLDDGMIQKTVSRIG